LQDIVTAPANVDPATMTNCIGIAQLDSDGTQLYIVYGGSAAQTTIPLGTNFPPMAGIGPDNGIVYELVLSSVADTTSDGTYTDATIFYRVQRLGTSFVAEGTLTPTSAAETPTSATFLAFRMWRTNNLGLLAVSMDFLGSYSETDL